MAYCTNCGAQIGEGNAFCTRCGTPVDDVPLEPSPLADTSGIDKTGTMSAVGTVHGGDEGGQPTRVMGEYGAYSGMSPMQAPVARPTTIVREKKSKAPFIIVAILAFVIFIVLAVIVFVLMPGGEEDVPDEPVIADTVKPDDASSSDSSFGGIPSSDSNSSTKKETVDKADAMKEKTPSQNESDAKVDAVATYGPLAATVPVPSTGYVIPDSNTHYLTEADLQGLSNEELFIGRNEIFARYGRGFLNADLQKWFDGQSWYTSLYTPEAFDAMESPLTDVEKANADLIRSVEASRNSPSLK